MKKTVLKLLIVLFLFFELVEINQVKGQSWQSFGNPNDTTMVMATLYDSINGNLIFSGSLANFSGLIGNYILKWDGNTFSYIGDEFMSGGSIGGARKLVKYNNQLIAAGMFDSIGTRGFKMPIARWDGSEWLPFDTTTAVHHPLEVTLNPHIDDMIVFDGKLFVIGDIRYNDPVFPFTNTFESFAYYDSTGWHSACNNTTISVGPFQPVLNIFNNELYIGGCGFYDTCVTSSSPGMSGRGIAKYNSQCQSVDLVGGNWGGIITFDMQNFNGSMYIGYRGNHPAYGKNITRFDGVNFSPLGPGLNLEVQALAVYNNQLVAGGLFNSDGNNSQPLNAIALWDGNQWNPFPGGCELNHHIYYLHSFDSSLIACGNFDSCGTAHTGNSVIYPNNLTSIYEANSTHESFSVFPNPASDILYINFTSPISGPLIFEMVDVFGTKCYSQKVMSSRQSAEITLTTNLPNGIYLCRVTTNLGINYNKVIVQR